MEKLIAKWHQYDRGEIEGLTNEEVNFLLENEEHEVFMFDFGLYRDIMDYRDHLEDEAC